MRMPDKQFYGVKDIQKILGVSYGTAYKIVQVKGFPKIKFGKRTLIPIDKFNAWIKANMENEIAI